MLQNTDDGEGFVNDFILFLPCFYMFRGFFPFLFFFNHEHILVLESGDKEH